MNQKIRKCMVQLGLMLVAVALMAGPSPAHTVDLTAEQFTQTIDPDGTGALEEDITMWGFALSGGTPSVPGPRITVPPGDTTLTINLTNNLAEPVSILIPGQGYPAVTGGIAPGKMGSSFTSFTAQADSGGTVSYTWSGLKPGTYIYHSASNLSKQVHMGLYGALTADAAAATAVSPAQAYPGIPYDNDVVLFYSEIDPALHVPPAAAHPNNYMPRYFLVNGQPYVNGVTAPIPAGAAGERTLVRLLSTALDDLVPTINGMYWDLIAEDGNPYRYTKKQYTALLSAMKTRDAVIVPDNEGRFAVFDRRMNLSNAHAAPGGMLAQLQVGAAGLIAEDDTAATVEDTPVTISVLANDPGATLVDSVTQGANGSVVNNGADVTYTPNPNFTGTDMFTYRSTDGAAISNTANVTVTVSNENDPPAASPDAYAVVAGETLDVTAPGVLANDSDPDGNPLTAVLDTDATGGTLNLNPDGGFAYTPNAGTTNDAFTYFANDGTTNSTTPATVTITVTAAPANQAPVANNDFAETARNTAVTIVLTDNDTDSDGNLDPNSVVVTGEALTAGVYRATSTRGGVVTNLKNGSVVYEPRRNFRGTDTFTYNVFDTEGAMSNQATVQVNVVR